MTKARHLIDLRTDLQGRSYGRTTLTESGGPGPHGDPGAPNRGLGRPTERAQGFLSKNERGKGRKKRGEKRKKKRKGTECSFMNVGFMH